MKLLLFLLPLCWFSVIASEISESQVWESFKKTYGKIYLNKKEENFRKDIFLKNLRSIEEHNRKYEEKLETYTMQINTFADRTLEEIFRPMKITSKPQQKLSRFVPKTDVPESIDWRDYGVITPIRDQVLCMTCWAFATVDAIEAHLGIYRGIKNISLSQQNLADCIYPNFDCDDDMESDALERCYQYITDNGVDTAESYPYEHESGHGCRYNKKNIGAWIKGYATITQGDEDELKSVVGTVGPVSVIITTDFRWTLFRKGIYYKKDCINPEYVQPYNHAVTIVGYGSDNGTDYWLMKNEWGEHYGDNGYIKMARNKDNACGVATYASYPLV